MFDECVEIILKHEGGYVNSLKDPGGETNFGISKRAYPKMDIKNLTRQQATAIYKQDYWDRLNVDKLDPWLQLSYFDCAINQGPKRASHLLEQCSTLKGRELLQKFTNLRLKYYMDLPSWSTFGKGWMNRAMDIVFQTWKIIG